MCESHPTCDTLDRSFPCMRLFMSVQVTRLCECFLTCTTLEGFLSCVNSPMCLQVSVILNSSNMPSSHAPWFRLPCRSRTSAPSNSEELLFVYSVHKLPTQHPMYSSTTCMHITHITYTRYLNRDFVYYSKKKKKKSFLIENAVPQTLHLNGFSPV
jgi:hypothetical protein